MAARKSMHPLPTEPALYGDRRRVALVTGAAKGLGRAISLRLAQDGLDLAINDLKDSEDLQNLKKDIEEIGRRCTVVPGDVSDEKVVEKMVESVVQALGYLDVMVSSVRHDSRFLKRDRALYTSTLNGLTLIYPLPRTETQR